MRVGWYILLTQSQRIIWLLIKDRVEAAFSHLATGIFSAQLCPRNR
jgi:hypothetical protein